MIIAIDGPAGSGKSSTARELAHRLGLMYIDTGAMYRAVALLFDRTGIEPEMSNAAEVVNGHSVRVSYRNRNMRVFLDDEDVTALIRTSHITELSSRVSTLPDVRTLLVAEQRHMADEEERNGAGVVMEGRDIGTVVFPNADIKLFLAADPEERARRRLAQIRQAGGEAEYDRIFDEINERDNRDKSRLASPLHCAEDALTIDTTGLSFTRQVDLLEQMIRERKPDL